jgi:5-methylcytosine-specific restriction enzyme A
VNLLSTKHLTNCELCKRDGVELTEHHLTPREVGGRHLDTALLCTTCHKQIHALFTNKELGVKLNTLNKLLEDEKIKRYLRWIEKQPSTAEFTIKKSRHVRKRHRK